MGNLQKRPNVLIIHADQHRYDCIGAYGNKDVLTPNIDGLAEDGVLYENSFCPFPVCTPSRYSLITGLYVHQHLGWSNHCTIPAGLDTFPAILKNSGYRTQAVGKMHFTPTYLNVGFEQMKLSEQAGIGRFDDDYHEYLKDNGLADRFDLMDQVQEYRRNAPKEYWDSNGAYESDLDEEHYSTTWIGQRALEMLEQWGEECNMLMVGFIKPHHPFDPPAPWSRMYDPEKLTLLPGWTEQCFEQDIKMNNGFFPHKEVTEEKLRECMALYYGSISQIDKYVGEMIDVLKQKGLYENTLIIYTSDHGDYMGYHHMIGKMNYMYEPLIKVPLIIKYPGQKFKNTVSHAMVNNVDLAPTILAQAGCERNKSMSGIDLMKNDKGYEFVYAESGRGNSYMIRSKTRKLLLCKDTSMSQFFDLEKDPFEMNNLFEHPDHQDEIQNYKERLSNWILFEAPTPVHVDENAATIASAKSHTEQNKKREEMIAYFREKMQSADEVLFGKK